MLGTPVEVTWSVDRGSISSTGLYTAPGGDPTGFATVTATAVEDDSVSDQIQLKLGCACWWSASIGGSYGHSYANWSMVLTLNENDAIVGIQPTPRENSNIVGAVLTLENPIPPGATGTFSARGTGSLQAPPSLSTSWTNGLMMSLAPLSVQVNRHEMLGNPEDAARELSLTVTGMAGNPQPDGTVLLGSLNIELDGARWFDSGSLITTRLIRCTPPGPL